MKRVSSAASHVSNCRRPMWARGATLVVPAALSVIALAGVSTGPALELGDRELALEAAEQRAEECDSERARRVKLTRADAAVVASRALDELRALIPADCSPVIAHGLVRTAAGLSGLRVDVLQIGPELDLALDGPRDRILAREVTLAGSAPLASVLELVSMLRGLGFPTSVLGVSFIRDDPSKEHFEYRIDLGLLHLAPLLVVEPQASGSGSEEGQVP